MSRHSGSPSSVPLGFVRILPSTVNDTIQTPFYYSTRHFEIEAPRAGLAWLAAIRLDKASHLQRISLHIHPYKSFEASNPTTPSATSCLWSRLIDTLAFEATNLRELKVVWSWNLEENTGCGDVGVVRSIGRLRGLQRLEIDGCFARQWPKYLWDRMGLSGWNAEDQTDEQLLQLQNAWEVIGEKFP